MNSLLIALCLILAPADAAPSGSAPLLLEAWTPGTRIRLKDVLDPAHHALIDQALLDLDLGRSPSPGFGRHLTRQAILSRMPAPGLTLTGPEEITIRTEVAEVTAEEILEGARKFLDEQTAPGPDRLVEVSRPPFGTSVPKGRASLELVPHFRGPGSQRGSVTVLTDVKVDGKLQLVIPTTFLLRTFREIPILAAGLARGQTLTQGQITRVRTETTHRDPGTLEDHRSLLGQEARRDLRSGSPLLAKDFQPVVLIRRNEAVMVIFERGAVRAETFGLARDSGSLGDSVRVENLTTKKILAGRVAGPGLVQINP